MVVMMFPARTVVLTTITVISIYILNVVRSKTWCFTENDQKCRFLIILVYEKKVFFIIVMFKNRFKE